MTVDELKQHLLSRGFDSDKYHCWLSTWMVNSSTV